VALDFLVEEGLTDFQKSLQRALAGLPHRPSDMADVGRLRAGLREVLAPLNYEPANAPVRGLEGALAQDIDGRVVASRNGFDIIHLHLPRLRASVERPAVERVIRSHPQCMVVATSRDILDEGAWHFINVKEAGAGRKVLRRAVIEPPSVGRTVLDTLSQCQIRGTESALEIQIMHDRAFDVEAVSKKFYKEYAEQFAELRDELQAIHGVPKDKADAAVQELLNRLIFLMFIQRKNWLPTPENPDRQFLWAEFAQSHRNDPSADSYHAGFLHPLFVALSRRKEPNSRRGLPPEVRQVPFLNGGLFDLDDDAEALTLPNSAFERIFGKLLLRYNFTIREDTPLEVEVAIDPEMLGRVFENLILQLEKTGDVDPRKATGSYYTPRPLVHFMCQQALKEWIAGQGVIGNEALDLLFTVLQTEQTGPGEREKLSDAISQADAERLRERLRDITVVDPAVGSGAFLLGMLHEMLAVLRLLDLLLAGQDEIDRRNYDYEKKREIIERCLYGVDIQTRAVRICELRLWLSLVVDYVLDSGESPPALPNLTYRVVQGDSLIEHLLGHEVRWVGEPANDRERQLVDAIQTEKADHFFKDDPQEKHRLEVSVIRRTAELAREILSRRDRETQVELGATVTASGPDPLLAEIDSVIQKADRLSRRGQVRTEDVARLREEMKQTFVWRLDFAEVFRRREGFDIAIANPPYVRQEAITSIKPSLRRTFSSTYDGLADVYVYFYDRALSVLAPSGVLCFISSNKYFRAGYGARLRRRLTSDACLTTIVDFGDLPVFDATTYPAIVIARNEPPNQQVHVRALSVDSLAYIDNLANLVEARASSVPIRQLSPEGWILEDPAVHELLMRVRSAGVPLNGYVGGRLYRGIVTGLNQAFLVRRHTREEMIRSDPRSKEVFRRFVRGRDIKRWVVTDTDLSLLYVPWTFDITRYPAILRHLEGYRSQLEQRPEVKTGRVPWFALSRYASDYSDEFGQPKIMYPHNSVSPAYAYDESGFFCNDKAYIIMTHEKWLLAALNSVVSEFELAQMSPALRGGYYEHRTVYVERLTVPRVDEEAKARLTALVEAKLAHPSSDDDLDAIVPPLFGLTEEDVRLMKSYLQRKKGHDLALLRGIIRSPAEFEDQIS